MSPKFQTAADFRSWFSRSVAVDRNGEPLLLFHGTGAQQFDAFEPNDDCSIFFSSDPKLASCYARKEGGRVIPVFVSLAHPYIYEYDDSCQDPQTYWDEAGLYVEGEGAIVHNLNTQEVMVVATGPSQICSAIHARQFMSAPSHDAADRIARAGDALNWLRAESANRAPRYG